MPAQTREIGVVLNPISYRNTCFNCAFESIERMISFAKQCPITRCVVKNERIGWRQRHRLLSPLLRTFVLAKPD